MKKFLTILVVFTVVCSTVRATEIDPKSPVGMGIIQNGYVLKVLYKGLQNGDVRITISNSKGEQIFTERVKNTRGFARPYNFYNLGEGKYTIAIEGPEGKQEQAVNLETKSVSSRVVSLRCVDSENSKYVLSIPFNKTENLKIKLYDMNNSLLHTFTEFVDGDFAKLYNLSKVRDGFYFEITGEDGANQTIAYR
jgi:hypothetical protein